MIERMFAITDKIKANQELRLKRMLAKHEAFMKEVREDIKCNRAKKEAHLERMEALLGSRPCEELTKACPENWKTGPEVMEAAVVTFQEAVEQVEVTNYEATEETEAAVKRQ
jgi:hypothetical protein